MDPFVCTRLVYDGCDPSDTWVIDGIGHSKMDMSKVEIMDVNTISEYEGGCSIHENERCMGHICRTPYGNLLPMQSLAVSTGSITNDVCKSARFAFQGSSQYHSENSKKILRDSMKQKTGRMRKGIVNCHIDGSLRMVIGPEDYYDSDDLSKHSWIMVPQYLRDTWKVVYLDEDEFKYKSRYVVEGDYTVVERPPALSVKSVQCARIGFWSHPYMGISPYLVKAFDGDFDGDEMHLFPVYSSAAVQECKDWIITFNSTLEKAKAMYDNSNIPDKGMSWYSFMQHTTLSFDEIKNGAEQPIMAEETRTTLQHLTDFRLRYDTDAVSKKFLDESIRGMADTNAQQILQPVIGDMARIAKLSSTNVLVRPNGKIHIATTTSFEEVGECNVDNNAGSPAMRGLSTMTSGIQQVALESHHAKKKSMPSHDMVTEMLQGGPVTFVMLHKNDIITERRVRLSIDPKMLYVGDDGMYLACDPESIRSLPKSYIKAAYSHKVLSLIDEPQRLDVCRLALDKVIRYYGFAISEVELECLSVLFSYKVELSNYPITTREGMNDRKLRWTEVMMSSNYGELRKMVESGPIECTPIETVSAMLMSGNFIGY